MVRISNKTSVLKMSPNNKPVAYADSGSMVVFETMDCFSNHIQEENHLFSSVGWDLINPATGPLYINGAEPGDTLKIEVVDIAIAEKGVMTTAPGMGVLGEVVSEKTKIVPIRDGKAIFNEKIQIPINPMIGVIGTAPEAGKFPLGLLKVTVGIWTVKEWLKELFLYLPVNVSGGLLAVGDLHAVMGDGEIVVCGVEIPGEVTLKVTVLKGQSMPLPILAEGKSVIAIASAETLDEAAKMATINMHTFLCQKLNMDVDEAGMLLSLLGDLKICQIVDPLLTARMEFPKWVLEKYGYCLD